MILLRYYSYIVLYTVPLTLILFNKLYVYYFTIATSENLSDKRLSTSQKSTLLTAGSGAQTSNNNNNNGNTTTTTTTNNMKKSLELLYSDPSRVPDRYVRAYLRMSLFT